MIDISLLFLMIIHFLYWSLYFVSRLNVDGYKAIFNTSTKEVPLLDAEIAKTVNKERDLWVSNTQNIFMIVYSFSVLISGYLIGLNRKLFTNLFLFSAGIINILIGALVTFNYNNLLVYRILIVLNGVFLSAALLAYMSLLREKFPNKFPVYSRYSSALNHFVASIFGLFFTFLQKKNIIKHNYFYMGLGFTFLILSISLWMIKEKPAINLNTSKIEESPNIKIIFKKFFQNYRFLGFLLVIIIGSAIFPLLEGADFKSNYKYTQMIGMTFTGLLGGFLASKYDYKKLGYFYAVGLLINSFLLYILGPTIFNKPNIFMFMVVFIFGLLTNYNSFFVDRINRSEVFTKPEQSVLLSFFNFFRILFGVLYRIIVKKYQITPYRALLSLGIIIGSTAIIPLIIDMFSLHIIDEKNNSINNIK